MPKRRILRGGPLKVKSVVGPGGRPQRPGPELSMVNHGPVKEADGGFKPLGGGGGKPSGPRVKSPKPTGVKAAKRSLYRKGPRVQ
jgi:hypothetical protein